MTPVVVVARVAPSDTGHQSQRGVDAVVGVEMRLHGEESLGTVLGVLLKGLDMVVPDVTAQRQMGRDVEVLANAIE